MLKRITKEAENLLSGESYISIILLMVIHFLVFLTFLSLHEKTFIWSIVPGNDIFRWDAGWYDTIRANGYIYRVNTTSNTAFFPLFPYFWKLTGLSPVGISWVNLAIFLSASFFLFKEFRFRGKVIILCLSIPSLLFFFVPYSESLFFLSITMFLIGIKRNWMVFALSGLFLSGLTRSSSSILLPAFFGILFYYLILSFYSNDLNRSSIIKIGQKTLGYVGVSLLSILIVVLIQYKETGVWFAYVKSMASWGRGLRLPGYPIKSWGERIIIIFDGIGVYCGVIGILLLGNSFIRSIKNKEEPLSYYTVFSIVFVIGVAMAGLFYQVVLIPSVNRYVFASPCFFVFLNYLVNKLKSSKPNPVIVYIGTVLFGSLFTVLHSWSEKRTLLEVGLFLTGFCLLERYNKVISAVILIILYLISTFYQAFLFSLFMDGKWVA